ncbi:hypothetical protein F0919_04120 [Taibaiella lutea]|uniref:Outer membrane protein beta-barrel domain-containing protein n=1 Tax=Taibaiella lutea TaxID=2608001 RepID=A0A5M6CPC5_9BACT|nr:hypothetical protein [Taibaiella lutea]KAA5536866.1 hypothetical protein F0919_04120 [Taibaiella lutea]
MLKYFTPLCFICLSASAQQTEIPISISVFNNGTSLPGSGILGVFSKTIHPGFDIGTYHLYKSATKHDFIQTFKLGYFYHQFNQHAIQLYSEFGYRYKTNTGFYAEGLLGVGYLHSFADVQQFKFKNGRYVKKANWGRPQLMATASIDAGYNFQTKQQLPLRIFLQYQFWMQTPFVNKYVPLLPNAALHLGIVYTFKKGQDCCHKI